MAQPMNSNGLPHPGGHRKKRMSPKRKIRLQALVLILFLVIPGNLVTLIIYSSTNTGKYLVLSIKSKAQCGLEITVQSRLGM